MRGLVTVLLAVITGMFCSFVTYLPFIGDVNSAPNQHVTPVYIERSVQDTGSPNIVTGLLADYRGFDTMWETTVMFLAGLTVVMLLSSSTMGRRPEKEDEASFNISIKNSLVLAGVGTFIYAATGWLAMLNGGNFLDYSYLPFKAEHTNELHALGILFIEIGVTICVMMTILNILDAVVERGDENGSAK